MAANGPATRSGGFLTTPLLSISKIQRRQQKDEIGEAWLFADCADFYSPVSFSKTLPPLCVALCWVQGGLAVSPSNCRT